MKQRCIMIFPELENIRVIDEVRERFDPLASHVRPHITLVFPFNSDISTGELETHLRSVLAKVKPFDLTLQGIAAVKSFGNYLFLNVIEGMDEIKDIHKKLYTGLLAPIYPQWLKAGSFTPHMTVGKLTSEEEFQIAAEAVKEIKECFHTIVNKISVEIIDENEDSIIEMEIHL